MAWPLELLDPVKIDVIITQSPVSNFTIHRRPYHHIVGVNGSSQYVIFQQRRWSAFPSSRYLQANCPFIVAARGRTDTYLGVLNDGGLLAGKPYIWDVVTGRAEIVSGHVDMTY